MPNPHGRQPENPSRVENFRLNTTSKVPSERKFPFRNIELHSTNVDDSDKENQPFRLRSLHSNFHSTNNLKMPPYQTISVQQTSDICDDKASLCSKDCENDDALQQQELCTSLRKSTLLDKLTALKRNRAKSKEDVHSFNSIVNESTAENKDKLNLGKNQSETFMSNQKSNLCTISEFVSQHSSTSLHSTVPSTAKFQTQAETKSRLNYMYVTPKDRHFTNAISADAKPKRSMFVVENKSVSAPLKPLFIHSDKSFLHPCQPSASNSKKIEEDKKQGNISRTMRSYRSLPHYQFSLPYDQLPPIVQKLQRGAAFLSKFPMRVEPGHCASEESDDDDDEEEYALSCSSESECEDLVDNDNIVETNLEASTSSKVPKETQDNKCSIKLAEQQKILPKYISENPSHIEKDVPNYKAEERSVLPTSYEGNRKYIASLAEKIRVTESSVSKSINVKVSTSRRENFENTNNGNPLGAEGNGPTEIKHAHSMPCLCQNAKANKTITVNNKSYVKLNVLGKGGSSKVYLVYDEEKKRLLGVKKVSFNGAEPSIIEGYKNEISLLCRLQKCDRVIKLFDYEYCDGGKEILVVMEKGDTDLATALRSVTSSEPLTPVMIKFYWSEMLKAVKEIHDQGIIHSDLKPANFLLVSGKLKLIDFGISSSIQKDMTSVIKDCQAGTINFMPPEALQDMYSLYNQKTNSARAKMIKINRKSDIWSLGCILYNLVYGRTPFQHIAILISKVQAIINPTYKIEFPPIEDTALLCVLKSCLVREPNQRPSIDDLLKDPYLNSDGHTDNLPVPARLSSILHQLQQLTPRRLDKVAQTVNSLSLKK